MNKAVLTEKAERLKALIDADEMLVLPNVWDVAGARIVAEAGYLGFDITSSLLVRGT